MTTPLSHAQRLFYDGHKRLQAGDLRGAEDHFSMALLLEPDFSEAMTNLGLLREKAGDVVEAEALYRRAIIRLPAEPQAYFNLGVLLLNARRFVEAEAVQRAVLVLAPESPPAWSGLGVLLSCLHRHDEARACYLTALRLDPGYAKARFNLSYELLRDGAMEEGWAAYETRDHFKPLTAHFTCPKWNGEDIAGKSLAIGFEGGHGDMIQFSRYVPLLKARGASRISLICPPPLVALFASLPGIDEVLPYDGEVAVNAWDYWTPPMSLPYCCATRLDSVPAPIPYLSAVAARLAAWAPRLAALPAGALRVGLVWKGNPAFENDAERSLPSLHTLAPLAAVPGIAFVSLQKGPGEDEARQPPPGMALLALGAQLGDFADTAAVIAGLDLVISVDSAVAHLAGAMGKPCWLLLPDYRADWRWMTGRDDTPWYPGMRLFRQGAGKIGDWPAVIAQVAAALTLYKKTAHSGAIRVN